MEFIAFDVKLIIFINYLVKFLFTLKVSNHDKYINYEIPNKIF